MIKLDIKTLIKGNKVYFDRYRAGVFYYKIDVWEPEVKRYGDSPDYTVEFSVPIEDIGEATLHNHDKAILFMRWIRKAMADDTITIKSR